MFEPYSSGIPDESILFPRYADGYNFIEAAYMSLTKIMYMNVVVGDPFCRISNNIPGGLRNKIRIRNNYPQPFNSKTTIRFILPKPGRTLIKIFDMLGREIVILLDEELAAGEHEVQFKPYGLSSGIYVCYIINGNNTASEKLLMIK